MGRAIVSFILALIFVGVLVGLGAEVYQSGVAQGIIDAGRVPVGADVGVRGFQGPDIFGLIFPILFLFLLFGLIRAAVWGGRGWGHGHDHAAGWGRGWDRGGDGPSGWREERERRMADMHRRFHEGDAGDASSGGSSGSMGSPGTSAAR